MITLLTTKLFFPPAHPNLVPRPRLIEQLNEGLRGPLTLIAAPAGYGKTTLMSAWRFSSGRDWPMAWLSLDADDNDPARFWSYLVSALDPLRPGLAEEVRPIFEVPPSSPTKILLTVLINNLSVIQTDFVLALDDVHVIDSPEIYQGFDFMLENLPPQMHLALLTRTDPPLALSRLRVRGQLTEIRTRDLSFTSEESTAFLNRMMKLELSTSEITALERRTEGWIAGLQLAALSMQGRDDVNEFITAFTGSHHYIMDYLIEEVLNRQPGPVRDFLLQTSILDRMTGSLCEALTGQKAGQATLERLERENLFLTPLDDERNWFRYHQLFSDMLRNRLEQTYPDRWNELHGRAAQWLESNEMFEEAVQYALTARDYVRATRLIEGAARKIFEREGISVMLRWMKALPKEVIHSDPRLCIYYAWTLAHSGHWDEVEPLLQSVEKALKDPMPEISPLQNGSENIDPLMSQATGGLSIGERLPIIVDYLRACCERYQNLARAEAYCDHALQQIPEGDLFDHSATLFFLGHIYLLKGETTRASETLHQTIKESLIIDNPDIYLSTVNYLGQALVLEGKLHDAIGVFTEASRYTQERTEPILSGIEQIRMGDVQREWNDLEKASENIHKGLYLAETGGHFVFLRDGFIARARLEQLMKNFEGAVNSLQEAEQISQHAEISQGISPIRAMRARLWIDMGDLLAAERWVVDSGLNSDGDLDFLNEYGWITLSRIFIAQNRLDEARMLLERLSSFASTAGRNGRVIEILILLALTHQAQGSLDLSLGFLRGALTRAQSEGYFRVFVDEGAPMAELLTRARSHGIAPRYVTRLLSAITETSDTAHLVAQPQSQPLSERELEVLELIAAGNTNQEIADELVIALGTAKRHIFNIYNKLDVKNRTECVARARALHILK